jgi:hypothetical protein
MKYLCLIYYDEKNLDALPPGTTEAIMNVCFTYSDEMRENGHYIAAEALHPAQTATTLRLRHGKVSTTDGPFAETKEQLGGFYLIEARDLNEAIRVASRIPPGRLGCIEVRPIRER